MLQDVMGLVHHTLQLNTKFISLEKTPRAPDGYTDLLQSFKKCHFERESGVQGRVLDCMCQCMFESKDCRPRHLGTRAWPKILWRSCRASLTCSSSNMNCWVAIAPGVKWHMNSVYISWSTFNSQVLCFSMFPKSVEQDSRYLGVELCSRFQFWCVT